MQIIKNHERNIFTYPLVTFKLKSIYLKIFEYNIDEMLKSQFKFFNKKVKRSGLKIDRSIKFIN